ncbi:MAG: glycosyltransferase family 4 protein [Planctomycetes bacterium]|nr:glycosyltransferase family 4 protein [Planctomycetota bacterium]
MSAAIKVLHFICEPGCVHGSEAAAAVARYATDDQAPLVVEVWAPKHGNTIAGITNRARQAGVMHRGPRSLLALRSFLVRERVDVVHCHDRRAAMSMALLAASGAAPATLYSVYAPPRPPVANQSLLNAAGCAFFWALRKYIDAVVTPSAYARDVVISLGRLKPAAVWKVPYGVSLPPKAAPGEAKTGESTTIMLLPVEVSGGARTLYYYFLQACRVLSRQVEHSSFVVVCARTDQAYVEALSTQFGIRDRVRVRDPRTFPASLSECAIAVLPTGDFQGIRPLLFAMAAGKAVVAPAVTGVREFVDPQRTGLLVRPSDSQALSAALVRLVSSRAARDKIATAAARSAGSRFSSRRMAKDLAAVYAELSGSKQR